MISDIDKDGSGAIDFEEFLNMMTAKMVSPGFWHSLNCRRDPAVLPCLQSDRDSREDIQRVFNLFDVQNRGHITFDDLRRVAKELGETMTEAELREMIERADADHDGNVTAEDFFKIMTKTTFS